MKRRLTRVFIILLSIVASCSIFIPADRAVAAVSVDIPSGYVVYDGAQYYLIDYNDLLDSYISYLDDPDVDEAKLARFYFDTLALGFEDHFIAYVSGITNKYVDFAAMLDKYIDTEDIDATYGWLNTDDATSAFDVLTEIIVLGLDGSAWGSIFVGPDGYEVVNPIQNHSVEIVNPNDPTLPESWSYNSWGDNAATFEYLSEGYADNRSLKVEVTGYIDGDAKWYFDPIELEPRDYVFSSYYKSNIDTSVILVVTTDAGKLRYLDMPSASASEDWAKYETTFTMPSDGATATIYHMLMGDGYLIIDDYHIDLYDYKGFDRGMVTITFDDGWEENPQTALPIMQQFGFKSNQFYATTYIENPWVANPKDLIQQFIDAGHEIGSHSVTHPRFPNLSQEEMIQELESSKQYLNNYLGVNVEYFSTPYGAYNTAVKDTIMTYYSAHRTVDSGYNSSDNFDISRLKCMSVLSTTTASEIEEWVQKAKAEGLWLILLYHRVADNPGIHDTTEAMFTQHMQVIDDYDIPVVTMSEAIAEIGGQ